MNTREILITIYLEYLNDYLTVEKYAADKGISETQAAAILNIGRQFANDRE